MRSPLPPAAALAFVLMAQQSAVAQTTVPPSPTPPPAASAAPADGVLPRAAQRDALVEAVAEAYRTRYVMPDVVPAIVAKLEKSRKTGRYDVASATELAGLISADLREASHDGHAYLQYAPDRYAAATAQPADAKDAQTQADGLAGFDADVARRDHHGLTALSVLPGNVRYLRIKGFEWVSDETGQAYDDAMRFLKGGDAAIVDLRGNGGGASEAVQYLVSHFLKAGALEITFLESGKEPVQTRALDNLPAGRMIGKPLYVLIDQGTGSAAESFAYDVQQFKLGTLVGANTAGAANNNEFVPIPPGFMLSVPIGRPVHAVSGANWEGVGVAPDTAIPSAQALDTAHALALKALAAKPASPSAKADYDWALPAADARLRPAAPPASLVQAAPGTYGDYTVTADKTGLLLARPGNAQWPAPRRLTPLTDAGLYAIEGVDVLRVAFKPGALQLWLKGDASPRVLSRK